MSLKLGVSEAKVQKNIQKCVIVVICVIEYCAGNVERC